MPNVMDKRIIINGAPGAWAYVFEQNGSTYELPSIVGTDLSKQMRFDNTKGTVVTMVRPDAVTSAAADEFVPVIRGDAGIIEFIKSKLTLDGATGEVKAGSGVTASGGSKGTIAFTANQSDIDSAEYIAYMNKLKTFLGATCIVCVPLGFNYIQKKAGATSGAKAPVGYAYMLATMAADPSHTADNYTPAAIAYSWQSKRLAITGSDITTDHPALDFGAASHKILIPEGMSAGEPAGYELTPPSITVITGGTISADFQTLLDGEMLFKIGV